jgi:hypothetical protein
MDAGADVGNTAQAALVVATGLAGVTVVADKDGVGNGAAMATVLDATLSVPAGAVGGTTTWVGAGAVGNESDTLAGDETLPSGRIPAAAVSADAAVVLDAPLARPAAFAALNASVAVADSPAAAASGAGAAGAAAGTAAVTVPVAPGEGISLVEHHAAVEAAVAAAERFWATRLAEATAGLHSSAPLSTSASTTLVDAPASFGSERAGDDQQSAEQHTWVVKHAELLAELEASKRIAASAARDADMLRGALAAAQAVHASDAGASSHESSPEEVRTAVANAVAAVERTWAAKAATLSQQLETARATVAAAAAGSATRAAIDAGAAGGTLASSPNSALARLPSTAAISYDSPGSPSSWVPEEKKSEDGSMFSPVAYQVGDHVRESQVAEREALQQKLAAVKAKIRVSVFWAGGRWSRRRAGARSLRELGGHPIMRWRAWLQGSVAAEALVCVNCFPLSQAWLAAFEASNGRKASTEDKATIREEFSELRLIERNLKVHA